MMEAGMIAITAFISPFRADREMVRSLIPHGDFLDIYCKATLETCEARDVKGLYKKARSGEIKNYTGIDSPYVAPINSELLVDTDTLMLEQSADAVIDFIYQTGVV